MNQAFEPRRESPTSSPGHENENSNVSLPHGLELSEQVPPMVNKSCQTKKEPSTGENLSQFTTSKFGGNLDDDSPWSKVFVNLTEIITKLQTEQKHAQEILHRYQDKYGPLTAVADDGTVVPPSPSAADDKHSEGHGEDDSEAWADSDSADEDGEGNGEDDNKESLREGFAGNVTVVLAETENLEKGNVILLSNSSNEMPRESGQSEDSRNSSQTQNNGREANTEKTLPKVMPSNRPIWLVHRVLCSKESSHAHSHQDKLFLDEPRLFVGDRLYGPCRGMMPIQSKQLKANPGLLAILYRDYDCDLYSLRLKPNLRLGVDTYDKFNSTNHELWEHFLKADGPVPIPESEEISIESQELLKATARLINSNRDSFPVGVDLAKISYAPYDFFYHYAAGLRECGLKNFQRDMQTQLMMLLDFVERYIAKNFEEARSLIAQGLITNHHISKLFRPGDVAVSVNDGHIRGYICSEWLSKDTSRRRFESNPKEKEYDLKGWCWGFDGNFYKQEHTLQLRVPLAEEPFVITDLNAYPLRLDKSGLEERLRTRGTKYWSCRKMRFVSYDGLDFYRDSMVSGLDS
jgi:hypothetical protein